MIDRLVRLHFSCPSDCQKKLNQTSATKQKFLLQRDFRLKVLTKFCIQV